MTKDDLESILKTILSASDPIQHFSDTILDYAILLAAVGTIAMALLELIKSLCFLRARYHQLMIRKWIGGDSNVLNDFFVLTTGEKDKMNYLFWRVIYDQPTEKLLGQIQAAANIALDYPIIYTHFYTFLTRGSEQSDGDLWLEYVKEPSMPDVTYEQRSRDQRSREASQARARLSNLIARRLDAFQTKLEYFWARGNQLAAVILGAAIFWYAILQLDLQTEDMQKAAPFRLIIISLLSGLVSPFAKDIVSALSGLSTKRE